MTLIDRKYQELGGAGGFLGRATTDERDTPDRRGRFRHYEGGSIYATLQTDAHEVHGAIRNKWAELKWERGFLGFPVTDERRTPDGKGRFNHFEGGSIYWTPDTDAHEVHGAIRDKWAELKWERGFLGFPVTDEKATPDGKGRFNHFEGGSIYWTPDTGAHEVHGEIRELWAKLRWERGWLGYPLTDELKTRDGKGRYNLFEGGSIHWTREEGARAIRRGSGKQERPKVSTCSISGRARGLSAEQASLFQILVYGPNDPHAFKESAPLDSSGRYAFRRLPLGEYRLTWDTRGKLDIGLGLRPSRIDADCRRGSVEDIDFEVG